MHEKTSSFPIKSTLTQLRDEDVDVLFNQEKEGRKERWKYIPGGPPSLGDVLNVTSSHKKGMVHVYNWPL